MRLRKDLLKRYSPLLIRIFSKCLIFTILPKHMRLAGNLSKLVSKKSQRKTMKTTAVYTKECEKFVITN